MSDTPAGKQNDAEPTSSGVEKHASAGVPDGAKPDIWKKASIIIAIVGLLGGTGWLQYFLERAELRRVEARQSVALSQMEADHVLQGFLYPLQHVLRRAHRLHTALTKDQELEKLEYAVDYLQEKFDSLPESDWRRVSWKALIETILADNAKAVELISINDGLILRDDFQTVTEEFVDHAQIWAASWEAVVGGVPVPAELWGRDRLLAPAFPAQMDSLLILEIEGRRRQSNR